MKTWIISVAVLIAIRLFPTFSGTESASRNGSEIAFNLNAPFRVVEASVFGILLGTFITPVPIGTWKSGWWQMILAILGSALLAYFAPGRILLSDDGITEKRLLGAKHITWRDVESAVEDKRVHKVTVTGNDGTEIVHTDMHVSASEFVRELEKSNLKVFQES